MSGVFNKTTDKETLTAHVIEELAPLGYVTAKKMFGGVGFFLEGVMFAKLSGDGTLYFRVDDTNRAEYERLDSEQSGGSGKKKGMPYYRVPDQILEENTQFVQWAQTAHKVALTHKK